MIDSSMNKPGIQSIMLLPLAFSVPGFPSWEWLYSACHKLALYNSVYNKTSGVEAVLSHEATHVIRVRSNRTRESSTRWKEVRRSCCLMLNDVSFSFLGLSEFSFLAHTVSRTLTFIKTKNNKFISLHAMLSSGTELLYLEDPIKFCLPHERKGANLCVKECHGSSVWAWCLFGHSKWKLM